MEAYAVFAGGGVKGAAFAGCLLEAELAGLTFLGYGGCSAGSLVALLASLNVPANDIKRIMVDEVNYLDFLGGSLELLEQSRDIVKAIESNAGKPLHTAKLAWWYLRKDPRFAPVYRVKEELGLYSSANISSVIKKLICKQRGFENLKDQADITFQDLLDRGAKPLKIVASNLRTRRAVVFPERDGTATSVLSSVAASTCYPFMFSPVSFGHALHVDGGLASNLPVFLFDKERKRNRRAVIAFDLITDPPPVNLSNTISTYANDLIATALSAGDALLRTALPNVHHICVKVYPGIDTLDFNISTQDKENLVMTAQVSTREEIARKLPQRKSKDQIQNLQASFVEPSVIEPALLALAREVEKFTDCPGVRCYITAPDGDVLRTIFQYGMGGDSDLEMQTEQGAGPSGLVLKGDEPAVLLDLDDLRAGGSSQKFSRAELNRIPLSQKALFCIAIYQYSPTVLLVEPGETPSLPMATLTIDASISLTDSGWMEAGKLGKQFEGVVSDWVRVISKLMS